MSKETADEIRRRYAPKSVSQNVVSTEAPVPEEERIATLLGAFQTRSYRADRKIYVGLTMSDLPAVCTDPQQLNTKAKESIDAFEKSGIDYPVSTFDTLEPVLFKVVVPNPIDYQDSSPRQRAKDVLRIGVTDHQGKTTEMLISEVDLLDGIVAGRSAWQAVNHDRLSFSGRGSIRYHTAIIKEDDKAYAMLFKPSIPETSNEDVFTGFVVTAVKQLLDLDSEQAEDDRHGYLEVAHEYKSKAKGSGGLLDKLINLDENDRRQLADAADRVLHSLTSEDDTGIGHSRTAFDFVGRLNFDDLMDMVADMQKQAHSFFRNSSY